MPKELLLDLRSKVEQRSSLESDRETLETHYRNEILPNLLQLRQRNRAQKNEMDLKQKHIKSLYQKLMTIQSECDCLEFEADCLGLNVDNIRGTISSESKVTNGSDLDHETRMRLLDEEEERRQSLQKKLAQLTEETKKIELNCMKGSQKFNLLKPYIKQLLDKVGPITTTEPMEEG